MEDGRREGGKGTGSGTREGRKLDSLGGGNREKLRKKFRIIA